jgi:signal transduction histidine kinase
MSIEPASSESPRILLVAPDDDARATLGRALAGAGASAVDEESDLDRALTRAVAGEHDCLIVDHRLGRTALDLVGALRGRGATLAVLLYSARPDEDTERAAHAAGVTDLVTPEDLGPTRLARRVRFAIRFGQADAEAAKMLARAQATAAARDELLAIVSHDLRSPLNAIVLACDALDADIGDAERKRYVAAIRRAGQRAERLLRDLLDVSRIESGALRLECRPISARSVLEQTRSDHELLARDAGSKLELKLAGDPGQILADRDRVLQVLANLVGNALKHAAGATITLEARGDVDKVELSVSDSGPGINPEQLPHVFDRFWQGRTRRRGGAGLGLTIARGIAKAHTGDLTVASEVGRGTRFTVVLPRPR